MGLVPDSLSSLLSLGIAASRQDERGFIKDRICSGLALRASAGDSPLLASSRLQDGAWLTMLYHPSLQDTKNQRLYRHFALLLVAFVTCGTIVAAEPIPNQSLISSQSLRYAAVPLQHLQPCLLVVRDLSECTATSACVKSTVQWNGTS